MASFTANTTDNWTSGALLDSGTAANWQWNYDGVANTSVGLESDGALSFVPSELADDGFEPIQGEPDGAKYLVSYLFKIPKDPVVFLKNIKDMRSLVKELFADKAVDHDSIIIHRISAQYKPTKTWTKKMMRVEELKLIKK